MEIQVHANMILAYLFSRFGDTGDGLESEASTYSLPVPDFPVSVAVGIHPRAGDTTDSYTAFAAQQGGFGHSLKDSGGYRENTSDFFDGDDGASLASSQASGGAREQDFYGGYGGGSTEYANNNAHTLESSSRRAPPPVNKPGYMGGTSANKNKRFSTISPQGRDRGNSSGNRVAGARAQRMTNTSTKNGDNNFKYYAYKRTSILDHELPVYNKR